MPRITLAVPAEMLDSVDALAEKRAVSREEILLEAVSFYLEEQRQTGGRKRKRHYVHGEEAVQTTLLLR